MSFLHPPHLLYLLIIYLQLLPYSYSPPSPPPPPYCVTAFFALCFCYFVLHICKFQTAKPRTTYGRELLLWRFTKEEINSEK
ncbi:hypothetical protein M5689_000777 [Euphorbia peplus]|nr:hypothetical protein M5689_000777 [Euphorbia peplus]